MSVLETLDPTTVPDAQHSPALIVAGSRSFGDGLDPDLVTSHVAEAIDQLPVDPAMIVSGTARGGDTAGEWFAESEGLPVERFEPDWETYGKAAGVRRNARMAHFADACLVFWDGSSPGSRAMIDLGCDILGAESVFVDLYREDGSPDPVVASVDSIQRRL